jgi:hypothetical protein
VFEEAHHVLPSEGDYAPLVLTERLGETVLITVHAHHVAPAILSMVDVLIAVGQSPEETLRNFADAVRRPLPPLDRIESPRENALCWFVSRGESPFSMRVIPGKAERVRHLRKYAVGDMKNHSFYFRGPANKHNLAASNLSMFCHIGRGIDEETWLFHLRRGDYSRWIRYSVRDQDLADVVGLVETRDGLSPWESRDKICNAIETKYTRHE